MSLISKQSLLLFISTAKKRQITKGLTLRTLLNLSGSLRPSKSIGLNNTYFMRLKASSSISTRSRDAAENKFTDDSDSDLESAATDLKNVSRLSPEHYQQYHGHAPDKPYKDLIHRQQRFASYGSACREDPRIMWPSRSAVRAMEEEEREDGTGTLSERLKQVQFEKNAAEEEKLERRKRIEQNMIQMPKWIAEYKQKQAHIQMEAKERAIKKEALLEEARDYFGYKVQANDPKFQQMVEEKEEKEKTEAKKIKKEEKAKKLAARMAQDMVKLSKTDEKTKL